MNSHQAGPNAGVYFGTILRVEGLVRFAYICQQARGTAGVPIGRRRLNGLAASGSRRRYSSKYAVSDAVLIVNRFWRACPSLIKLRRGCGEDEVGLLFRAGQRSGRAAMSETSFPVAIWHRAATACHYGEKADWGGEQQQHNSGHHG